MLQIHDPGLLKVIEVIDLNDRLVVGLQVLQVLEAQG